MSDQLKRLTITAKDGTLIINNGTASPIAFTALAVISTNDCDVNAPKVVEDLIIMDEARDEDGKPLDWPLFAYRRQNNGDDS